jgi:hypothetical protein
LVVDTKTPTHDIFLLYEKNCRLGELLKQAKKKYKAAQTVCEQKEVAIDNLHV